MDDYQKRHITENLWDLVTLTSCNTSCMSILTQNNVLSIEDRAELESIPNGLKRTEKLYELLLTKKGSYPHLITALEEGCQTGALEILKKLGDKEENATFLSSGATLPPKRRKEDETPIRFDVLAPVLNFTGRDSQLCELHQKLQENLGKRAVISQMASVVGLGGIGKTEVARKYIEKYSDEFYSGNVIWISAQNEETLCQSFHRLASVHLNISLKELDIKTIVDESYKHFNEQRVLFVFDNAESSDYLQKFMPFRLPSSSSSSLPYILITSRDREWRFSVDVLELEEMTEEEAVCFVKKGLKTDNDFQVLRLVNRLQRYPLALSQAVSFIKQRQFLGNFSISQYLEKLEVNCEKLLDSKKPPAEFNTYRETTLTTWRVTTQQISSYEEHGRCAMEILNSISYFLPDKIPIRMFANLSNGEEYEEALHLLVKYSMVNIQREEKTLSVHRLVQNVTNIQLKKNNEEEQALRMALELISSKIDTNGDECLVSICHGLSAYVLCCVSCPKLSVKFRQLPWRILNILIARKKYAEAHAVARELESLILPCGEIARSEFRLAVAACYLGENPEAQAVTESLERLLQKVLENKHNSFSESSRSAIEWLLIPSLVEAGRCKEALDLSRNSFQRQKILYSLNHWQTIDALVSLATCIWKLKMDSGSNEELSSALTVLKEATSTNLELVGKDLNWTNTIFNVAKLFSHINHIDSATEIINEVIQRATESCDERLYQIVIDCMILLGEINEEEGKLEDAFLIYQNVQSKLVDLEGGIDERTLASNLNVSRKFWEMGEMELALKGYTHALKIMERDRPQHPQFLVTQLAIVRILIRMGRVEEGRELLQQLRTNIEVKYGNNHTVLEIVKELIAL